jgi:hypothetical protein
VLLAVHSCAPFCESAEELHAIIVQAHDAKLAAIEPYILLGQSSTEIAANSGFSLRLVQRKIRMLRDGWERRGNDGMVLRAALRKRLQS